MTIQIQTFHDTRTDTLTFVVFDAETRDAVVIDPVLDYNPIGSKIWTESVDDVIDFVRGKELTLHAILETHAHADHLSGSQMIKKEFPEAQIAIGARIVAVQKLFKGFFDLPKDFPTDGSQFDLLLEDNEVLKAGSLEIKTIYTPGHTPACATYLIEDALFTGDALFMPDQGTGRCDFPAGSAADLYDSITERLYTLPDATRVFVGHDYQPGGREVLYETTIADSKANNVQLPADRSKEEFIQFREARDATLEAPRLLFQSVQVNVDAGNLPEEHANHKRYLKIPINIFRPAPDPDANVELSEV
ncbi:MAG: MBL fold metallo-hydrolase [Myxococcales bacterium]|nr:MBL fold metallo-hydrolase [Myxococcales bacterium]